MLTLIETVIGASTADEALAACGGDDGGLMKNAAAHDETTTLIRQYDTNDDTHA